MGGGQNLPERISDALEWCNTLLLVWSQAASASDWVKDEWTNAFTLRKLIIPCKLDTVALPAILANKLFLDFRSRQNGIAELLRALKLSISQKPVGDAKKTERVARAIHTQLAEETEPARNKPPQVVYQPPGPYPSLRNIIDKRSQNMFVNKIFGKDESAYFKFLDHIDKKDSWKEAKAILDLELQFRKLGLFSREATKLSDMIFAKFFSKGKF